MTVYGVVYVPPGHLEEFTREPLAPTAGALMDHEQFHATRQHADGMLVFNLRYLESGAFRWTEESLAYEVQLGDLGRAGYCLPCLRAWFLETVTSSFYRDMVKADEAGRWFDARYPLVSGLVHGFEPAVNPLVVSSP